MIEKIIFNKSSGSDPYMIEDPARIASELRNLSTRPYPGRAGPVKKIRPEPGPARIRHCLIGISNKLM